MLFVKYFHLIAALRSIIIACNYSFFTAKMKILMLIDFMLEIFSKPEYNRCGKTAELRRTPSISLFRIWGQQRALCKVTLLSWTFEALTF